MAMPHFEAENSLPVHLQSEPEVLHGAEVLRGPTVLTNPEGVHHNAMSFVSIEGGAPVVAMAVYFALKCAQRSRIGQRIGLGRHNIITLSHPSERSVED